MEEIIRRRQALLEELANDSGYESEGDAREQQRLAHIQAQLQALDEEEQRLEAEELHEVERVLDVRGRGRHAQYLVRWLEGGEEWVPRARVGNLNELLIEYHRRRWNERRRANRANERARLAEAARAADRPRRRRR